MTIHINKTLPFKNSSFAFIGCISQTSVIVIAVQVFLNPEGFIVLQLYN